MAKELITKKPFNFIKLEDYSERYRLLVNYLYGSGIDIPVEFRQAILTLTLESLKLSWSKIPKSLVQNYDAVTHNILITIVAAKTNKEAVTHASWHHLSRKLLTLNPSRVSNDFDEFQKSYTKIVENLRGCGINLSEELLQVLLIQSLKSSKALSAWSKTLQHHLQADELTYTELLEAIAAGPKKQTNA
ncbi:hypothetical protein N0V88_001681 [Collariella sp. IMI 366227]|nr:hypothetical protein N0V88_001681 [Collariella sp. IMI 366227]